MLFEVLLTNAKVLFLFYENKLGYKSDAVHFSWNLAIQYCQGFSYEILFILLAKGAGKMKEFKLEGTKNITCQVTHKTRFTMFTK